MTVAAPQQEVASYHLVTFGCQMNKYDSERIAGILASRGMTPADNAEEADLIVINTCSIREKAENKVFSLIGKLALQKENNPRRLIALGGCVATMRKEEVFRRAPALDLVFGPDSMDSLPAMIDARLKTGKRQIRAEFSDTTNWDGPENFVRPSSVSAWVGIMKGCDNHCSYCVVPSTRGPEVSRTPQSIMEEVRDLAAKGYREINLLGQNVNSYGKGLEPSIDFPRLLDMVEGVDGIERIRFMTSHPKDLTDRLIEVMASSQKICPSFHLPLQAGSDRILKMMNRSYTAAQYLERVNRLKEAVPGIAISTDLMVAFPSETEEEFEETIKMMEAVRFDSIFLFIYSVRPGTPAADMEGIIPRSVATARFQKAYTLHKKITAEKGREMSGRVVEVLCEGPYNGGKGRETGTATLFGKTPHNQVVLFKDGRAGEGDTLKVKITGISGFNLNADPV